MIPSDDMADKPDITGRNIPGPPREEPEDSDTAPSQSAGSRKHKKDLLPIVLPIGLVLLLWIIHFIGLEFDLNLQRYGLRPRSVEGLRGILTMPFLHGSWSHLFNNSVPLLVLGWALLTFYRSLAFKTLIGIYIISGIWLWISGRPSIHIGASGVVYGLAAFLFLSGWLRREKKVAALSLLVAFLYGGLWWGVLPVDPTVSWEGHLWGGIAGFTLALLYRKQGPRKKEYRWEHDEELERIALGKPPLSTETTEDARPRTPVRRMSPRIHTATSTGGRSRIVVHFKPAEKRVKKNDESGDSPKDADRKQP